MATNLDDSIILIPRQRVSLNSIGALEIRPDTVARCLDLGLLLKDDTPNRVQRDRIPHQLQPMLIPIWRFSPQE